MAQRVGLEPDHGLAIWRAFGLQPHRADLPAVGRPGVRRKVRNVVGLYLSPTGTARCCALTRSRSPGGRRHRAGAAIRPRQARETHPRLLASRNVDLFAALNVEAGKVIARHAGDTGPSSSGLLDPSTGSARRLEVHVVLDNRHPQNRAGERLARKRPRFHLHFTPTSASWLNLVESWFALLTRRACNGVFASTS